MTASLALADTASPATPVPGTPPPSAAPATPAAAAPSKPKAIRAPAAPRAPFYRDTTEYPPLKLTWNVSTNFNQVLGVFPHPILPRRAALTTQTGLFLTDDTGRTWIALPEAAAEKVGPIRDVAFHPLLPDTFYLASQTKGIWITSDQGKTFTQIGAKAKGLASDTVTSLIVYPGDPSHQTLLAVHGDAAPGLSCSRDGGQTWEVVDTDYHFLRLLGGEGDLQDLYLTGSTLKEPDIQSLYTCSTVGEFVLEVVRDVVPTDMAFAPIPFEKSPYLYLATSDSGLYRIEVRDRFGHADDPEQIGSKDDDWASVNVAWGPSADALNLYLYDPAKRGLVNSGDDLATGQTASDGVLVGSLIKEGAVIRPNANGSVFYASVNGSLSIGRESDDVPVVEINPAIIEANPRAPNGWQTLSNAFLNFSNARGSALTAAQALCQSVGDPQAFYRQHAITVTARLPLQPAPPTSVTVDLSRYGGTPDMPLFDDGRHDDGAAGDGVYGGTYAFLPELHRPRGGDPETRSVWPGRVAIGVRATFADGHHQGAVGVIDIYSPIVDLTFWDKNAKKIAAKTVGPATVTAAPNPAEIHNGVMALRADTQPGSWSVLMNAPYNKHDINGYEAVSFWIRVSDGAPPKELYVQLADEPEFSAPTTTERIPILNGKTLGADYFHVVIPLSKLIGPTSPFQSNHLARIILSGESTAPATFFIDDLQILARDDDPAPADPSSK